MTERRLDRVEFALKRLTTMGQPVLLRHRHFYGASIHSMRFSISFVCQLIASFFLGATL